MQIQFCGAARQVTGSKHLLTTPNGKRILLDCGLFQGHGQLTHEQNQTFGFDPKTIDVLILSHAHIDHSGLVPRLVRQGFQGKIYATPATRDLCEIMLLDSAKIQESDVAYTNKRRKKKGLPLFEPLYEAENVKRALELFETVPYAVEKAIDDETTFRYIDVGHLYGSATVNLSVKQSDGTIKKIFFSGDIGRPYDTILRSPEPFPQCDFMICESTYGNRLHEKLEDGYERFKC